MSDIKQNITSTYANKIVVQRLIQSWSLSGKLRKTSFINKLADKGLIHIGNQDNNYLIRQSEVRDFSNIIDSMITILNNKYESNWDFHLEPKYLDSGKLNCFILSVKLLYPEITITNTRDESHVIKDLIVMFHIKSSDIVRNSYCPFNIEGGRATMTFNEWYDGYNHSHLHTHKPTSFSSVFHLDSFCTGSDTEINNVCIRLNTDGYSEELFELYLYTIDTLVSWESIEGSPYKYFSKIPSVSNDTHIVKPDIALPYLKNHYDNIGFDFSCLMFNYTINNGRFVVKKDALFDEYVKSRILNAANDEYIKLLIIKKVGTTLYGFMNTFTGTIDSFVHRNTREEPYTIFQGRKIGFYVEPFLGEPANINEYKTHPKFLEYVANKLEEYLYHCSVRKSTIRRQNQGIDA